MSPVPTAALAVLAAAYLTGARRTPGWSPRATTAFLAGIAALAVTLESPLHSRGEELLSVHMVQHLLLTLVVPPLLVLGRPLALALRGGPRRTRRPIADLLRSRTVRALTHPAVAFAVFAAVLVGTHAPAFYDLALRDEAVHDVEHALYFYSALLFWQVVLAPEPHPHASSPIVRMLLLLGAMLPTAVVGVGLLTAGHVVYPTYALRAAGHGAAMADQRTGGSIMWLWGTLGLAVAVLTAGWWGVVREERRALAREAALERALGGRS